PSSVKLQDLQLLDEEIPSSIQNVPDEHGAAPELHFLFPQVRQLRKSRFGIAFDSTASHPIKPRNVISLAFPNVGSLENVDEFSSYFFLYYTVGAIVLALCLYAVNTRDATVAQTRNKQKI